MELCTYCIENILKSKDSWDYHQCDVCVRDVLTSKSADKSTADEAADETTAGGRCLFCSTLRDDIEALAPDQQHHAGYRWTVRSLSRIRESLETVVVTFHPVPPSPSTPSDPVPPPDLPTRTFYFFPEADLGPLPDPKELGKSTDPAKNGGAQIKSWLTTCNETHTNCMKRHKAQSASISFVPTRLLDVSGPPRSHMKVIETAKTTVRGPYATLSHCWGPRRFVRLLRETEKQYVHGEGVPWHMLTKNFQEAVEVARFLGVEYIWIDSLCIVQGPGSDFETEGALMHQVYRNSYCNIAIVDSADDEGGLFRRRNPHDVAPVRYQPDLDNSSATFGNKAWRVLPSDMYESELLKTKLYVRGWVFQERMLAPRSLHFAHRQVFWDCASISACESLPAGLPPPMDGPARPDRHWRGRLQLPEDQAEPAAGPNDEPLFEFWKSAVRRYTSCKLTQGSDKMKAIWGIAKLVRDALHDEYGMGLWEQNLEDQLTWWIAECELHERPTDSKADGIARNFPTWSWASMDGRIEIPDRLSKSNKPHWTVKGHTGRPLRFLLEDSARWTDLNPPKRLADLPSPSQSRGMSDTVVEQRARHRVMQNANSTDDANDGKGPATVQFDRNQEPKFKSTSLPITGHVGRGTLMQTSIRNKWRLQIEGLKGTEIEAFPDVIPNKCDADSKPFFVVLSAKQDVKKSASNTALPNESSSDEDFANIYGGLIERIVTKEYDVSGIGILMKEVRPGQFHRSGAFRFQHAPKEDWEKMLEPAKVDFWLD